MEKITQVKDPIKYFQNQQGEWLPREEIFVRGLKLSMVLSAVLSVLLFGLSLLLAAYAYLAPQSEISIWLKEGPLKILIGPESPVWPLLQKLRQ